MGKTKKEILKAFGMTSYDMSDALESLSIEVKECDKNTSERVSLRLHKDDFIGS